MEQKLTIDSLITIDETGMPKAPTLRQLLDKEVRELYQRDPSKNKVNYIKDCGVIYCLGDPKSPPKQRGYTDKECVEYAKEYYDLPKGYVPDKLVLNIAKRYYEQNITEAGIAVEILQQAVHNSAKSVKKLNEYLNDSLVSSSDLDTTKTIISVIQMLKDETKDIPVLVKRLEEAKQNLLYETQTQTGRGGVTITSSMDADEY